MTRSMLAASLALICTLGLSLATVAAGPVRAEAGVDVSARALSISPRRVVYEVMITNNSSETLSGVAAILALHNSRPLPLAELALDALLQIPGGVMPGETVHFTDSYATRDDLLAARLREDDAVTLSVRLLSALDPEGARLTCDLQQPSRDWRLFRAAFEPASLPPLPVHCYGS